MKEYLNMLNITLLQRRFALLLQHQREINTLDAFLLLTTEKINPKWNNIQKKNALNQFDGWKFTQGQQQIFYQSLLDWLMYNVDKDKFIQQLDYKNHWYEHWAEFYLYSYLFDTVKYIEIANIIATRPHSKYQYVLLRQIIQDAPCFETISVLAKLYLQQQLYDQALHHYQQLLQHHCSTPKNYTLSLKGLLETLLQRNHYFNNEIADAEYAMNILLGIAEQDIWDNEFELFFQKAQEKILNDSLKQGRAKATHLLGNIGRSLNLFSKSLGKKMGGGDATLPYSQAVVDSAPSLLTGLDIEKALNANVHLNTALNHLLKQKSTQQEAAITALGLSIGSLWTYSQINPQVLDAISFASKGSPDEFGDLQDIGEHTLQSAGAITRLTGYVAEQQVAMNLIREGHTVALPDSATQVGWDLLVDGVPMQVKSSMSADYVLQHFEKYPDIPVITNSELATQLGDHPLVIIDPNLSHIAVQATTNDSLQHLSDFGVSEGLLAIPLLSIAFAAHRNYGDFSKGRIDIQQYGKNIGKEVVVRTAGASTGKIVGGFIGSTLGPVGIIAGAGIGAYIGGIAGGTGADALLREDLCRQSNVVTKELRDFAHWFNDEVVKTRLQQLQQQRKTTLQRLRLSSQQQYFSTQPIYAHFIAIQNENLARIQDLQDWFNQQLNEAEFYQAQAGWVALRESGKFFHKEMKTQVAKVNAALQVYEKLLKPEPQPTIQTVQVNS